MTIFQTVRQGSIKILCLAGLMGFGPVVFGAPPLPGLGDHTGRRTCFVNRAAAVRTASARVAGAPVIPLPSYQVLVLRVQFTDRAFLPSSEPGVFFQQVREYYSENSFGAFEPTFTISPVFCNRSGGFTPQSYFTGNKDGNGCLLSEQAHTSAM